MKRFSKILKLTVKSLVSAALLLPFSSCSMMEEDLSDCPTGLYVSFKYDYNIQRADMFNDHVGGVSVYVFDEGNRLIMRKDEANASDGSDMPLHSHDYRMHFNESELPEGNYRLLAMAFQKDYDATLTTDGAKYRRTELRQNDEIEKLKVSLDHETTGEVKHENTPLDTLWMTKPGEAHHVSLRKGCPTYETVGLIRDTKQLNLTLRQLQDPANMHDADYDVKIMDKNGTVLYDNSFDADDVELTYTPWAQWTSQMATGNAAASFTVKAGENTEGVMNTAHYELDFNRLTVETPAKLLVTRKDNGKEIIHINLPEMLANGRSAYELAGYGKQEYLDREHEYHLDFFLVGDKWQYVDLRIDILAWFKRIQNVELQ